MLFTESDLSGISLTWMGVLETPPKLALRFQRSSASPDKEQCQRLTMSVDGGDVAPGSVYKADAQGAQVRETVQAELDLDTLSRIAASRQTTFTVCGRSRRLTVEAAASGARFLQTYRSLAAQVPTPLVAPEPRSAEEVTAQAPNAEQAVAPSPASSQLTAAPLNASE